MLQVLIVDDEPMICQLILHLVDWGKKGTSVSAIKHDGASALEFAEAQHPDIIITDIRIPGFDGLELIRKVQAVAPNTRFIVISGYRHFEYARSALRYGVTDYLLKPINEAELNRALDAIIEDIHQKRSSAISHAKLKEQLSETGAQLRQQFFSDLVTGHICSDTFETKALNRRYHFKFRNETVHFFIIKATCLNMQDYELMSLVFSRTIPVLQSILQPNCSTFELLTIRSRLYCMFQFNTQQEHVTWDLRSRYRMIADQFDDVLNSFESFRLTLCLGQPAAFPQLISKAAAEAEHTVRFRLQAAHSQIVDWLMVSSSCKIPLEDVFPQNQLSIFSTVLQSGEPEKVKTELQKIFSVFQDPGLRTYDTIVLFDLCETLLRTVEDTLKVVPVSIDLDSVRRAVDHTVSSVTFGTHFTDALMIALAPYFSFSADKTGAPIQKAIRYIESHYAEPLTLDLVAQEVPLSSAYLSSLFKKETGITFSEYITLCRMNAAKHFLRHTSDPVSSIAEQVGYPDTKYFSRVFTKTFGISPQKYRNL